MIPMHLSSNIPSTSANSHTTRLRGTVSGGTVRYMYGIPVVSTISPVRIKIRRPLPHEEIYGGAFQSYGPRTMIERKFNSRPATVAARRKKLPTRTPIFDIVHHVSISIPFCFPSLLN